jgi:hypothetical protein
MDRPGAQAFQVKVAAAVVRARARRPAVVAAAAQVAWAAAVARLVRVAVAVARQSAFSLGPVM